MGKTTAEYQRNWRKKNKDRVRAYNAKRIPQARAWKYGLSQEEYSAMLKAQNNCCAICVSLFQSSPTIDHDHKTEKVRGLLCMNCNLGLGHFRDEPLYIASAIRYLGAR